jgi:hypothetical protein
MSAGGAPRPVCSPIRRWLSWKPSRCKKHDLRKQRRRCRMEFRSRSQRALRRHRCNRHSREVAGLRCVSIRPGQSTDHHSPYLFRRDDLTQADFITPASGPAESSDIVVRFTQLSKTNECGVIPVWVPSPRESNTKVQWTPLAGWRIVFSCSPIREGAPPNVHFYP